MARPFSLVPVFRRGGLLTRAPGLSIRRPEWDIVESGGIQRDQRARKHDRHRDTRTGRSRNVGARNAGRTAAGAGRAADPRRRGGGEPSRRVAAHGILSATAGRSEEHTSELQSLMRNSYAGFCLKKKKTTKHHHK